MFKSILRFVLFFVLLAGLLLFADYNLIKTDTVTAITLHDFTSRDDMELAVVGSSVVLYHFNPEILTKETGLKAGNVTATNVSLQGCYALTQKMYKTNHPEWVVLVVEPYTFNSTKESTESWFKISPFLQDPEILRRYYFSTCREDGQYIERALTFRTMYPTSLKDLSKTWALRHHPEEAFARYSEDFDEGFEYMGNGYLRVSQDNAELREIIRTNMYKQIAPYDYFPLLDGSKEMLREYRNLVESQGSHFMVAVCPNHTSHVLAEVSFIPYTESLMHFCKDEGIPCYNFQYATPELLPNMDETFFDLYHMNGEGSDTLSAAFSRVFNKVRAGEDVSDLFHYNSWHYLRSIDYIVNAWVIPTEEPDTYLAECNTGSITTPLYSFVLRDAEGKETLLRDYDPDPNFVYHLPEGCQLRVYARSVENPDAPSVYYDYPGDYNEDYYRLRYNYDN